MPQAMPVIQANLSAAEAPAPAPAEAAGAGAPFSEVLAKASGAPPAAGRGGTGAATGAATGAPPAPLLKLAMPLLDVAAGNAPPAPRSGRPGALSAKEGGKDLPPLFAMSWMLAPPLSLAEAARALAAPARGTAAPAPASQVGGEGRTASAVAVQVLAAAQEDVAKAAARGGLSGSRQGAFEAVQAALPTGPQARQGKSAADASALPLQLIKPLPELKSLQATPPALAHDGQSQSAAVPTAGGPALAATLWPAPAGNAAPTVYQGAVPAHVTSPHWGQDLGQQLLVAVHGNSQTVTLHINPPQLGPLEVHLQVTDGQASALFVSPHMAVRQALEGALPQLRDIFAGAGMSLLQSQVSADGGGSRRERPPYTGRAPAVIAGSDEETVAAARYWRLGFINTYV